MHLSLIKFVAIVVGSAVAAVLGMLRDTLRFDEDPSNDGPRALIAEFLGFWIGGFFLIWSFAVPGTSLQWTLRAVALVVALAGLGLASYFAGTPEVSEAPAKEPTGFKNDTTSLHLE
jgi:hypothetical protein